MPSIFYALGVTLLLALLLITAAIACIRYDVDTGEAIAWSKEIKAWVPEQDFREGKDTFPGYVAPIVRPYFPPKDKVDEPAPAQFELVEAKWGLQPHWAKSPNWGAKTAYNARSETIREKPTFRDAFKRRRCAVPVSHFYEQVNGRWLRFSPTAGGILAIAGLWEPFYKREDDPDAEARPSYTLVTCEPGEYMAQYHDRQLVILPQEEIATWMDSSTPDEVLNALMTPLGGDLLKMEDVGSNKRKKKVEDGGLF